MVKAQSAKLLKNILLLVGLHVAAAIGVAGTLILSFGSDSNDAFAGALIAGGLIIVFDFVLAIRAFYAAKTSTVRALFAVLVIALVIPGILIIRFVAMKQIEQTKNNKQISITSQRLVQDIKACNVLVIADEGDYLQLVYPDISVNGQPQGYGSEDNVIAPHSALAAARQAVHEVRDSCTINLLTNHSQKSE